MELTRHAASALFLVLDAAQSALGEALFRFAR
jgi:hypothetical protein